MIVSCGEALVDLMPDRVDGALVYRPVLGGSPYNVAVGVARLGGRAAYLWEVSTDTLGEAFAARLAAHGVDCTAVRRAGRATPVAIVDLSGTEPRYNIADPDRVMHDTALPDLPAGTAVLAIGSAVLAQEPVAAAIEALAARAPLVAIDYNVRLPSISDLAAYRARLERISRRAGIVKVSEADLSMIGVDDAPAYLARMLAGGASLAVLTRGGDGVAAWTGGGTAVTRPALAVEVVDAVGAGDAFMAGLLASLQSRNVMTADALRTLDEPGLTNVIDEAQRVAATACTKQGAVMPDIAEVGDHFRPPA